MMQFSRLSVLHGTSPTTLCIQKHFNSCSSASVGWNQMADGSINMALECWISRKAWVSWRSSVTGGGEVVCEAFRRIVICICFSRSWLNVCKAHDRLFSRLLRIAAWLLTMVVMETLSVTVELLCCPLRSACTLVSNCERSLCRNSNCWSRPHKSFVVDSESYVVMLLVQVLGMAVRSMWSKKLSGYAD